jgi:hypothetical protein
MARRDEGAYLQYVTEEQRSPWDASAARATDLAIRGPYELHDSIEQPARLRAHSGRFSAKRSLPGCSSKGRRSTSSSS